MMYDWLPEEEKLQLHAELADEEIRNIEELEPKMRFFRLLHFIQVKYIEVGEWTGDIFHFLEIVNSKCSNNMIIQDLVFRDANDKEVSLRGIQQEIRVLKPQTIFRSFLEELRLREEFSSYLNSLRMKGIEW